MASSWLVPDPKFIPREEYDKKEAKQRTNAAKALSAQNTKKKSKKGGNFGFLGEAARAAGSAVRSVDDISPKDVVKGTMKGLDTWSNQVSAGASLLGTRGYVTPEGQYTTRQNIIGNPLANVASHIRAQRKTGALGDKEGAISLGQAIKTANRAGKAFREDPDISPGLKFAVEVGMDPLTYGPSVIAKGPQILRGAKVAVPAAEGAEVLARPGIGKILGQAALKGAVLPFEGFGNNWKAAAAFTAGGAAGTELANRYNIPLVPEGAEQFLGGLVGGGVAVAPVMRRQGINAARQNVTEVIKGEDRVFHGTPYTIPKGQPFQGSIKGDIKSGFYVASSPGTAGNYVEGDLAANVSGFLDAHVKQVQNKIAKEGGQQMYMLKPKRDLFLLSYSEPIDQVEASRINNVLQNRGLKHRVQKGMTGKQVWESFLNKGGNVHQDISTGPADNTPAVLGILGEAGWDGMTDGYQHAIWRPNDVLEVTLEPAGGFGTPKPPAPQQIKKTPGAKSLTDSQVAKANDLLAANTDLTKAQIIDYMKNHTDAYGDKLPGSPTLFEVHPKQGNPKIVHEGMNKTIKGKDYEWDSNTDTLTIEGEIIDVDEMNDGTFKAYVGWGEVDGDTLGDVVDQIYAHNEPTMPATPPKPNPILETTQALNEIAHTTSNASVFPPHIVAKAKELQDAFNNNTIGFEELKTQWNAFKKNPIPNTPEGNLISAINNAGQETFFDIADELEEAADINNNHPLQMEAEELIYAHNAGDVPDDEIVEQWESLKAQYEANTGQQKPPSAFVSTIGLTNAQITKLGQGFHFTKEQAADFNGLDADAKGIYIQQSSAGKTHDEAMKVAQADMDSKASAKYMKDYEKEIKSLSTGDKLKFDEWMQNGEGQDFDGGLLEAIQHWKTNIQGKQKFDAQAGIGPDLDEMSPGGVAYHYDPIDGTLDMEGMSESASISIDPENGYFEWGAPDGSILGNKSIAGLVDNIDDYYPPDGTSYGNLSELGKALKKAIIEGKQDELYAPEKPAIGKAITNKAKYSVSPANMKDMQKNGALTLLSGNPANFLEGLPYATPKMIKEYKEALQFGSEQGWLNEAGQQQLSQLSQFGDDLLTNMVTDPLGLKSAAAPEEPDWTAIGKAFKEAVEAKGPYEDFPLEDWEKVDTSTPQPNIGGAIKKTPPTDKEKFAELAKKMQAGTATTAEKDQYNNLLYQLISAKTPYAEMQSLLTGKPIIPDIPSVDPDEIAGINQPKPMDVDEFIKFTEKELGPQNKYGDAKDYAAPGQEGSPIAGAPKGKGTVNPKKVNGKWTAAGYSNEDLGDLMDTLVQNGYKVGPPEGMGPIAGGAPGQTLVRPQEPTLGLTFGEKVGNKFTAVKKFLIGHGVKNDAVATPIAKEYLRINDDLKVQATALGRVAQAAERILGFKNILDENAVNLTPEGRLIQEELKYRLSSFNETLNQFGIEKFKTVNEFIDEARLEAGNENKPKSELITNYGNAIANKVADEWLAGQIKRISEGIGAIEEAGTKVPTKTVNVAGAGDVRLPPEVADVLTRALHTVHPVQSPEAFQLFQAVNNTLRGLWASMDASFLGINMLPFMADNPLLAGKVIGQTLGVLQDPTAYGKYLAEHDRKALLNPNKMLRSEEWISYGSHVSGPLGEATDIGGLPEHVQKIPGIGKLLQGSNRLYTDAGNFSRLAMNDYLWENYKLGGIPLISNLPVKPGMTDDQVKRAIAQAGNRSTGYSRRALGGPVGSSLFFAPRFMQSQLETIFKAVTDGSIEGHVARRQMIKLFGIGVGITYAINRARGEETEWDPRDSNFLRIRNVNGSDISLFGPWDSLIRGVVRSAPRIEEDGDFTLGDPSYLLRSKLSPVLSTALDLAQGENVLGQDVGFDLPTNLGAVKKDTRTLANLLLPFSVRKVGQEPITSTALGFAGFKSSPLTGSEQLENDLKNAGINKSDPDYLIKRRQWMADNPDKLPKSEDAKFKRSQEIQADIKQRRKANNDLTEEDGQTLVEFREARKKILAEQRARLDEVLSGKRKKASTQQEKWLESYFKLFDDAANPITGETDAQKFDAALGKWINKNGSAADRFVQDYLGAGLTKVERAYHNDLRFLQDAGYFDMDRYVGMESDLTEDAIDELKQEVTQARVANPALQHQSFAQTAKLVLGDSLSDEELKDVIRSNSSKYQSKELQQFKDSHRKELMWFNPNAVWSTYNSAVDKVPVRKGSSGIPTPPKFTPPKIKVGPS